MNKANTTKHRGPKLLEHLNKHYLKENRPPTQLVIKQIWLSYVDNEQQKELNEDQALLFLLHVLRYTRLSALIKDQEAKNSKVIAKDKRKQYWEEFASVFLHEIDPKVTGVITFDQFSTVLSKDWGDFLKNVIYQGQEHRLLTIRLRKEQKRMMGLEQNGKRKKKE